MPDLLRLVAAALLLSVSWMTVFRAPTRLLWLLSIGMTEFPLVFSGLALLLFLPPWSGSLPMVSAFIMSGIAFGFFISPVIMGALVARKVRGKLAAAFGEATLSRPFSFFKMFTGQRYVSRPAEKITYHTRADGSTLQLDLYRTQATQPAPCVVVVHGGSWAGGDSTQLPKLNHVLAGKGYVVAAINYSLAPAYRFPQPPDDLSAALDFLRSHATEYGIAPEQFFLLGRSAGGQVALLEAYRHHRAYIRGIVSFYAPADMVWAGQVSYKNMIIDSPKVMKDYLGASYADNPQVYADASPLEHAGAGAPPTLLFHGLRDELVYPRHAVVLEKKLRQQQVKALFIALPWATHGFDYSLAGPGGQISTSAVLYFLEACGKKQSSQRQTSQHAQLSLAH